MNRLTFSRLVLVLGCCWSVMASAGLLSDEDNKTLLKEESALALPAPPKSDDLMRYAVGAGASMTFTIDAKSVSVGDDQIVRYSSVITSPSGVMNVSYEGIRCKTAERKLFATGGPDGSWNTLPDAEWRRISSAGANSYQATLFKEFFCDGGAVAGKAAAIVDRIRYKKPLR
ncbi:MAG: hypothetical protein EBZ75_10525 [Oxalobacteraceae bacterium]|nr:hypothetical protein [Oxalobacteraceae bacterium]